MTFALYSLKGNCDSHLLFQWESNASENNILVAQYGFALALGLFPLGCYDHDYTQYVRNLIESH
jgi:hypothetical protein